ncbi:MAG: NAD(P)/FAD-dependent oxidoreductase [Lentimicrobium sp.]|jgi:predicted Rossmann fold flavoprotein|nr:NAD(P)/FAD-dependent oxidoreductase [Lentimicrobium sp.]
MIDAKHFRTIIIGAGPAGLFAHASLNAGTSLLLEKKNLPGRKLMISGTGQCNFTHAGSMDDFKNHYGKNARFLNKAFDTFSNEDAVDFFRNRKINSKTDENGKVFPSSMKAGDILQALLDASTHPQKKLLTSMQVMAIQKTENIFIIKTSDFIYTSDFLIVATGGKSYPTTGSTGDGYTFASSLGHTIVEPNPALTAVTISDYPFMKLAGVSFVDAEISQWRNGSKLISVKGDLLLTHTGLSGPVILNNSRFFRAGDKLVINFCNSNEKEFEDLFIYQASHAGKSTIGTFMRNTIMPKNLVTSILQTTNLNASKPLAEISKTARKQLINLSCAFPFTIEAVGGFKSAMVTSGGVALEEINALTMESTIVPRLYFCGEVIDIDGDTGGYNIQAAFSTAYLAARDINKKATG